MCELEKTLSCLRSTPKNTALQHGTLDGQSAGNPETERACALLSAFCAAGQPAPSGCCAAGRENLVADEEPTRGSWDYSYIASQNTKDLTHTFKRAISTARNKRRNPYKFPLGQRVRVSYHRKNLFDHMMSSLLGRYSQSEQGNSVTVLPSITSATTRVMRLMDPYMLMS